MKYIVIKAPAGKFFKIFDDHDAAEKYTEADENN